MKKLSDWFPFLKKETSAQVTDCLICFYHAGGSASSFHMLRRFATEHFIALAVELPGHGVRRKEPPESDIRSAAEKAAKEIFQEFGHCNLWIYGHSLGALFAYETCWYLEKHQHKKIEKLILTGRNAPSEKDITDFKLSDGHEAFLNEMKRYGVIPEELLENQEFMQFYEPMIYHDYELSEKYYPCGNHILTTAIHFDFALQDTDLSQEKIQGWKNYTTGGFSCTAHTGNHFFIFEKQYAYFQNLIQKILSKTHFKEEL